MQRIEKKYYGVIVPMVTPLKNNWKLDSHAVTNILNTFKEGNVNPFILGTTGESVSLSSAVKLNLVKEVLDIKGKNMTVFAGISSNCFSDSVEEAEKYAVLGVDAVVAHLPFYYPLSSEQIFKYYEKLADAITCPLILYNNPITVKQSIPLEIAEQLSHHPNIAGIKDSERGIERLEDSIRLWKNRSDFVFLVGWSVQSAYSLLNGADGIVPSTGNLVPGLYKQLFDSAVSGDKSKANELQEITNRITDFYMKNRNLSQSIPSLKFLMSLNGLCQPYVTPPLDTVDREEEERLKRINESELHELIQLKKV